MPSARILVLTMERGKAMTQASLLSTLGQSLSGPGAELGFSFLSFFLTDSTVPLTVTRGSLPWKSCSASGSFLKSFVVNTGRSLFHHQNAYPQY